MSEEMEHWQTLADWRWQLFDCPYRYCKEPAGRWCTTQGNRVASQIHGDRGRALINVAHQIYAEGHREGQWWAERKVKTA